MGSFITTTIDDRDESIRIVFPENDVPDDETDTIIKEFLEEFKNYPNLININFRTEAYPVPSEMGEFYKTLSSSRSLRIVTNIQTFQTYKDKPNQCPKEWQPVVLECR